MPENEFIVDLRDIRFTLFESLPFHKLTRLADFADVDRASIDLVLEECHKFAKEQLAPLNRPGDEEGCQYKDGQVTTPSGFKEAYRACCENGWLGVSFSPELGGMGLPSVVGAATAEMYVGACCSLSLALGLTRASVSLLAEHGSEALKAIYLAKLVTGEWQGTMCLTEPQAGSAVGDTKCLATPDGDSWLLTGSKSFITAADHDMCDNHVHLVLARTPGAPKGFKGISLFLVPKYIPDADGAPGTFNDVICAGIEHKMGIKGSPTGTLNFGEKGSCRGWLIGEVGKGLNLMFHMMNEARVGVGLQGLALSSLAYNYARQYANERVQGVAIEEMRNVDAPRVTIAHHPDVSRMLLWCKAIVEGSRALVYYASFLSDLMDHSTDEKEVEQARMLVEFLTPICKAYVSDRAFEATVQALQVLGGYGYCSEYPIEQAVRDSKIASIYEGTNGIQALDLMGRKLSMAQGLLFRTLLGQMQGFVKAQKGHLGLGKEVGFFAKELERWSKVTMDLGVRAMRGDQKYPVLCATPYLEMAGNTVVAWLLLQQAVVAHDKLHTCYIERGAMDAEARATLHREDQEVQFYFNKIETARFFVYQILPKNQGIAAQFGTNDRSALNWVP